MTEDGRVYYENLRTKVVTWSLEADGSLIFPSAIDSVDKILESSRSDCEQIIGSPFPVEESMAQMIALQEYCDEHDAGAAHENDAEGSEALNTQASSPIPVKSPFPVALDQFTDDEGDDDDEEASHDSKNWDVPQMTPTKKDRDSPEPKSRPPSTTTASIARSDSKELSTKRTPSTNNAPNGVTIVISRDSKQKLVANVLHVSACFILRYSFVHVQSDSVVRI